MGHNHEHKKVSNNILVAFALNASFAIIEVIGGYLTNSVAIMSDALHDFGDSLALLISYFAEKYSHKQSDEKFTFGYRRFSLFSALLNGVILLTGGLYVIYEAINRIMNPEPVIAEGMILLALLGILVNSFAAYKMSKNEGMNSKMVMYHLLEDLLGWIAVLIVSVILIFKPWYILDSILSILISLVILKGVYKNMIKIGMIFLQKFPDELELNLVKSDLIELDLVEDVHAFRGWALDSESFYLRFHVSVPKSTTVGELGPLKKKIKEILLNYKVSYSTIEFEDGCSEGSKLSN